MTQTEWSHLPNAKHIDWVIASIKVNPEKWTAAYTAAGTAAWGAAWSAAYNTARTPARGAAWNAACTAAYDEACNAARDAARTTAWYAATDAIVALVAYDDCAYMIESEIGELKIIAVFGDQRAILLLPACIVFNETKELV